VKKLVDGSVSLGITLNRGQQERFTAYYQELRDWNRRLNLTAITDYDDVLRLHFLDSLSATLALPAASFADGRFLDVGSGAGLPGIPLKITFPEIRLTLLEATGKKADFLKHLAATLGLEDIEIVKARAEDAAREPRFREGYDIVLSRAVAALSTLAELTLPFCRPGGRCIAFKKAGIATEIEDASYAVSVLGGAPPQVVPVTLEELPDDRCLVMTEKIAITPDAYPRRAGIPDKRPLRD